MAELRAANAELKALWDTADAAAKALQHQLEYAGSERMALLDELGVLEAKNKALISVANSKASSAELEVQAQLEELRSREVKHERFAQPQVEAWDILASIL